MTFEQWWEQRRYRILAEIATLVHRSGLFTNAEVATIREQQAACWNAAIDESRRWMAAPADRTEHTDLMANALKVTPVNGVMQKLSQ